MQINRLIYYNIKKLINFQSKSSKLMVKGCASLGVLLARLAIPSAKVSILYWVA